MGTGHALLHFGMGELIEFEDLKPGSFLNFTRYNGTGHAVVFMAFIDDQGKESLHLIQSLTTFNKDGRITGKYGTNNSGNGSVLLYDKFGNRGWFKSGKNS